MPHDRVIRVAGYVQDPQISTVRRGLLCEAPPAELGHHHIGHQQMNRVGVTACQTQGLGRGGGRKDRVTMPLERLARQRPDFVVVLDQEDRL
jgi:hypothetical protein